MKIYYFIVLLCCRSFHLFLLDVRFVMTCHLFLLVFFHSLHILVISWRNHTIILLRGMLILLHVLLVTHLLLFHSFRTTGFLTFLEKGHVQLYKIKLIFKDFCTYLILCVFIHWSQIKSDSIFSSEIFLSEVDCLFIRQNGSWITS